MLAVALTVVNADLKLHVSNCHERERSPYMCAMLIRAACENGRFVGG